MAKIKGGNEEDQAWQARGEADEILVLVRCHLVRGLEGHEMGESLIQGEIRLKTHMGMDRD